MTTTLIYYYVHTPRTPQQSYIERRQQSFFSRSILEFPLAIDTLVPGTAVVPIQTPPIKNRPPRYKTLRRYYCTSRSLALPSGPIRHGTIQNETFRNGTIPYGTIRVRRHLFVEPCGTKPYGTEFSRRCFPAQKLNQTLGRHSAPSHPARNHQAQHHTVRDRTTRNLSGFRTIRYRTARSHTVRNLPVRNQTPRNHPVRYHSNPIPAAADSWLQPTAPLIGDSVVLQPPWSVISVVLQPP